MKYIYVVEGDLYDTETEDYYPIFGGIAATSMEKALELMEDLMKRKRYSTLDDLKEVISGDQDTVTWIGTGRFNYDDLYTITKIALYED